MCLSGAVFETLPTVPPVLKKHRAARGGSVSIASELLQSQREMITVCGRVCQLVGLPRSVGQIYGLIYLSAAPLTLDDVAQVLGISKASASTGTRQLMNWGAIRHVWVQGDRRDHFEAVLDFGGLIRRSYADFVKPKLLSSGRKLNSLSQLLQDEKKAGLIDEENYKVFAERLVSLSRIQRKIEMVLPLAEQFL